MNESDVLCAVVGRDLWSIHRRPSPCHPEDSLLSALWDFCCCWHCRSDCNVSARERRARPWRSNSHH